MRGKTGSSRSTVSIILSLPGNYLTRIRTIDGVRSATSENWFGGMFQDDRNQITAYAVDHESFFDVYPEFAPPEAQLKTWLTTRTSVVVGSGLAKQFGWKVGDSIPLRSNFARNREGSDTWDVDIAGIYDIKDGDNSNLFLRYDYFNEARTFDRDSIGGSCCGSPIRTAARQSRSRSTRCSRTLPPRPRPRPRAHSCRASLTRWATSARS